MFTQEWYAKQYWKLRHLQLRLEHDWQYNSATDPYWFDSDNEMMEEAHNKQTRLIKFAEKKVQEPSLIAAMKPEGFDHVWWVGDLVFPAR